MKLGFFYALSRVLWKFLGLNRLNFEDDADEKSSRKLNENDYY